MTDQEESSRFDKFTGQARNVLLFAQEEAVRFQHNYIGTEHLLLGLVREEESGAARVLANLSVDLKNVRSAVAYIIGIGDRIVPGEIGLTPRAKKVIEFAVDEARRLNHHSIGTEHLLLGLVFEGKGMAVRVLVNLGVNQEEVKTQLLAIFNLSAMPESQSSQERSSGIIVPPGFKTEIRKVQHLEILSQRDPRVIPALIQAYKEIIGRLQTHKDPMFYAAMYNRMGIAYRLLSAEDHEANLQMAIKCFHEALRFYTPETDPLKYAETQNNLGNAYGDLLTADRTMNLRRAISCYEETLRFWTPEAAPLKYAAIQNNLGVTYVDMPTGNRIANLERAIKCFQEALRFRTPETDPLKYAETQNNLGVAYCNLPTGDRTANLKLAIWCYQEVLRFWTPDIIPFAYARTQNNLGNAYSNLPTEDRRANLAKAIECYQKALRFLTPEVDPLAHARTQITLGNAYRVLLVNPSADLAKAIECYQKALRFLTPEVDPLAYAGVQNNLGLAYGGLPTGTHTANLAKAIECFQKALLFQTPETDPFAYAATKNSLGLAYRDLVTEDRTANLAKAIECFQKALRFYTLELDPSKRRTIARNLAELYFDQGVWDTALSTYHIAMEAGEQLYRIGLSTESKTAEVFESATLYPQATFAAVRCGEVPEALLILEQGKTRLLSEALRLRVRRPSHVPDEIWETFQSAAAAVRAEQTEKTFMDAEAFDPVQAYEAHVQASQTANATLNAAIEQIRIHAPHFLVAMDLSTVEAQISDRHTALLAFCITEQGSIGFVMSQHNQEKIQLVEVPGFTRTDLHRLVWKTDERLTGGWLTDYDRFCIDRTDVNMEVWQGTITRVLAVLGECLLTPILSTLSDDIKRIVFLPSAELFLFPLHAVPLFGNGSALLCDRYEVSYAPSLEVLSHARARAGQGMIPALYAVINPEENASLPFALTEGAAITQLFAQHAVDIGQVSTKERVLAGMQERTYIHFACHGSYDWDDPSASGLHLAGERLTLADLQQGDIALSAARLVTLSACETGVTDVMRGSAGEYVGIPAGFLLAGVPCVIGSLWAVPDISTAMLMERFYQNHLQGSIAFAAALREAQKWVRDLEAEAIAVYTAQCYRQASKKDKHKQGDLYKQMGNYRTLADQNPTRRLFAHPYYWAAFTVNGI